MYVLKPLFDKNSLPKQDKKESDTKYSPGAFAPKQMVKSSLDRVGVVGASGATDDKISTVGKINIEFSNSKVQVKEPVISSPKPLFNTNGKSDYDVSPEDAIRYKGFQSIDIKRIKERIETIDMKDRVNLVQYGQDVSKKLVSTVDEILSFTQAHSLNVQLDTNVTRLNEILGLDFMKEESNSLIGTLFGKKKTVEEKMKDAISQVEMLTKKIDDSISHFVQLIPKIDEMLDRSKKCHLDLMIAVRAGQEKIKDFERRKKPKLEESLNAGNVMTVQNARDELDIFQSFVKRIETLNISLGQNELTIAQIRMSQATNVKMVESLNNIISNLIPLWKQSMISAMTTKKFDKVFEQKDVLSQSLSDIISPNSTPAV